MKVIELKKSDIKRSTHIYFWIIKFGLINKNAHFNYDAKRLTIHIIARMYAPYILVSTTYKEKS